MAEKNNTSARMSALRALMRKNKLDGLIVTNNLDQLYLTGFFFFPEETVLLVHAKGVTCFTRELYIDTFKKFAPKIEVAGLENRLDAALEKAKKLGLKRVGFDSAKETYQHGKMMSAAGCVEMPSFVSLLRETKDAAELKLLRDSNRIAFEAYEYVRKRIKTGMTENDVATELERFMRAKGASAPSFLTIIGFGENSANPHHSTGDRKLKANDAILMDFGCIYKGYCSDITRCWWHGKNEPAEYKKIWNIVEKARKAGVKTVKAGAANKAVDAAARQVIADAGYGEFFTHRTGHGVGMEIHEAPYNTPTAETVLAEGNVVTVEPGIYLPGKFGVRLEDTVAATKTGAKILTKK